MTSAITRPAVAYRPTVRRTQITPYTAERAVIGTPTDVARTLDLIRQSGRLIAATRPRPMPGGDLQVCVNVRVVLTPVRSPRQVAADRRRVVLRQVARTTAVVVPVLACTAVAAYAVARLLAELLRLLPYIGGALVLVLLAWAVLGRAGVCPGLHCPGPHH